MGVDTIVVNGERTMTGESRTVHVTRSNDNAQRSFRNAQIQGLALLLQQRDQPRSLMGYPAHIRHQAQDYQKAQQATQIHIFQRKIVH